MLEHRKAANLGARSAANVESARHRLDEHVAPFTIEVAVGDELWLRGADLLTQHVEIDGVIVARGRLALPLVARATLRGQVRELDEPRRPLPAKLVVRSERSPDQELRCAVDGAFSLRPDFPPPWSVECESTGYCPSERTAVDDRLPLQLELARPIELCGRVVTADDRPIVGASIRCGRLGVLPVDEREVSRSDADGFFTAAEIPLAAVVLSVQCDGFAATRREVEPDELRAGTFLIRLDHESRFNGRVVDAETRPIAGAEVIVGSLTDHLVVGWVMSDERGNFALPWTADGRLYHVEVRAPGFAPLDAGPYRAPADSLLLPLERLADLAVRIVDPIGAPIAGARVIAIPLHAIREHESIDWNQSAPRATVTDASGQATCCDLAPIPHRVLIAAQGFDAAAFERRPGSAEGTGGLDTIVLRRATPRRVQLVDGNSLPIAGVIARPAVPAAHGRWLPHPLAAPAISDRDGMFRLEVPVDSDSSWICERGSDPPVRFELPPPTEDAVWRWPRVGSISVTLDDALARRATALHLLIDGADGAELALRFSSDAHIVIPQWPVGCVRLRLLDEWLSSTWHNYAAQERVVTVEAGTVVEVPFASASASRVEGRIGPSLRVASGNARVVARRVDSDARADWRCASVELDGRFVLLGMEPGSWEITAFATTANRLLLASKVARVVSGVEMPPMELDAGADISSIQLRDMASSAPVAAGTIELHCGDGPPFARIETSDAGLFECCGTPAPNGWWLQADADGHLRTRVDASVGIARGSGFVDLQRPCALRLTFARSDGATLSGTVRVHPSESAPFEVPIQPVVTLPALHPGPIDLEVDDGTQSQQWRGELVGGATTNHEFLLGDLANGARAALPPRSRFD